ncbi:UDP-N-acetylenolpyruvoylglucosamine reductase [Hahella chejuensis KCTC 2396]|uniref:UDP-N-acetylenolpyruvoylglucosamine reductase n=1 Tax=Hahella chejuensis (strain KCTC 2396) TaxID=349521 RepID=Q2SIN0_HAHCH|nr:UDP-N-acetylmuramate dehydrogenase [Hahella chejuensis]ABC29494.1 UDP-N-acetylenolpyruvoylglucosamine reductase [Hahella chejuensis KCTC 2396]
MRWELNADLAMRHTMGCPARVARMVSVTSINDIRCVLSELKSASSPAFVLGGGSNVVFTRDLAGVVIKMENRGVSVDASGSGDDIVRAAAGENWHEFVWWTLARSYVGLENLALIPGTVGAAPIQNIGAYGVELKDRLHSVRAVHMDTLEEREFSLSECCFGYRDSFFKSEQGRRWLIWEVAFRLSSDTPLVLEYAELRRRWELAGAPAEASAVAKIVEAIRAEKLPDPAQVPNSGSFFKNPVVSEARFLALSEKYPEMVSFPLPDGSRKLAAGWLIQACGWKGFLESGVGVYPKQALVLINPGHKPGSEVKLLASRIQASVEERFGVSLEVEPLIL